MYNDTLKVANKIITSENLLEIFDKMNEVLKKYLNISKSEEITNRVINYSHQSWTYKNCGSHMRMEVDFYDAAKVTFDNYENFISTFNNRLEEIKSIDIYYCLNYNIKESEGQTKYYIQSIYMHIHNNRMSVDVKLSSEDRKLDEVYELIKSKILNAPVKYDDVIKNKNKYMGILNLSIGLIPSIIIMILSLFSSGLRYIYVSSYILFPIIATFLAFIIGGIIISPKMNKLYENINPGKKYAGYDINKGSIYKDDIDQYVGTSEILIGKNTNNLRCRKKIVEIYNKYKNYIYYEIGVLLALSIIVLFLK